jgi:hypothetical protein
MAIKQRKSKACDSSFQAEVAIFIANDYQNTLNKRNVPSMTQNSKAHMRML